ncbi:MAG: DUF2000 domain-containing protein [Anaerolineae bacterium]|nr:DUF2000 domain-containing protein [Anaerolineae bacterium]
MKCVIIIDQTLPLGLIANTAAVLAMSIGNKIKGIVGEDVLDRNETLHRGITQLSIPMLKGDDERIRTIRTKILEMDGDDIFYVDFCDVAQKSRDYDHYKAQLRQTAANNLHYLGLAIYGPDQAVRSLTGNLGLLR